MKQETRNKEAQSEREVRDMLRLAKQTRQRQLEQLPMLTDERLARLYDGWCRNHVEVPPVKEPRHRLAWQQVLSALVCLAATGGCMVYLYGSDDVPMRILMVVLAALGTLLAVWSLFPRLSSLFPLYVEECADEELAYADMGMKRCAPIGVTLLLVLLFVFRQPVGDGYLIALVDGIRIEAVGDITYMLACTA